MELLGGGFWWRLDGMAFGDERIQIDHLDMTVKRFEDGFPTDTSRQGGDGGEVRFFRHDADGRIRDE